MNNFPSQDIVSNAVISGMLKAKENFLFWTNSRLLLSDGPHKIITIHVAQEIQAMQNPPEIYIDATVIDILKCSLSTCNEYPAFMKKNNLSNGVFSITLDERHEHENDDNLTSRAVITIKSGVINSKLEYLQEIERICIMIGGNEKSTLDYGMFAFYADISAKARKKLDVRLKDIMQSFDEVVKKHDNLKSTFKGGNVYKVDDNGEWTVGCYVIERLK